MNIKRIIVGLAAISLTHTALANNIMERVSTAMVLMVLVEKTLSLTFEAA